MKWLLPLVLLVGCDCGELGPPRKVSSIDGCDTYRMSRGCSDPVFFTKCVGEKTVTTSECHRVQSGKASRQVCSDHAVVE